MTIRHMGSLLAGSGITILILWGTGMLNRAVPVSSVPASIPAASTAPAPSPDAGERARLLAENDRLNRELQALRSSRPVTPAPSSARPTPSLQDLEGEFEELAQEGMMLFQSPKYRDLIAKYKDAGREGMDSLLKRLAESESSTDRFLAAALLEGLGDPAAIPGLASSLARDEDDLVRRMTSHALALIGTGEATFPLRQATQQDKDWGVRANSAYGLAKLGLDDGLTLLQEFYESEHTPREYKLGILGGMSDVGHPRYVPAFRNILSSSRDMGYLLMAIGGLEKAKDKASIADLERVVGSDLPQNVREAAQKAIRKIQG